MVTSGQTRSTTFAQSGEAFPFVFPASSVWRVFQLAGPGGGALDDRDEREQGARQANVAPAGRRTHDR